MDAHVGFESWAERDVAMMLDFDPDVVGFSSQPFWPPRSRATRNVGTRLTISPGSQTIPAP